LNVATSFMGRLVAGSAVGAPAGPGAPRRLRRRPRRSFGSKDVNLTSMMDLMTIILVFLLESMSGDPMQLAPSPVLQLPISSATAAPRIAVSVVVTQQELVLEGIPLLRLSAATDPATGGEVSVIPAEAKVGGRVEVLYDRLREELERGQPGELLVQCDRRLPYAVIRDVTWTAGQAGFSDFRFVVIKGS
jgi:biopolymer transport protein ExbD